MTQEQKFEMVKLLMMDIEPMLFDSEECSKILRIQNILMEIEEGV